MSSARTPTLAGFNEVLVDSVLARKRAFHSNLAVGFSSWCQNIEIYDTKVQKLLSKSYKNPRIPCLTCNRQKKPNCLRTGKNLA
jgi:hypothetical protein